VQAKTAVVTGAASGIGLATARLCARKGMQVAICDLNAAGLERAAEELEREGKLCVAERADVSDRAAVARFADRVHERVDAIDLLVNNAGIAVMGRFWEVPLEEWDRVIGVNLSGVAYLCHGFVPRMIERGRGGQIVNVASMAGYVATPRIVSYHATKFGVVGFSESLRLELAPHGIGVTAVCPGVIDTPIVGSSRTYGVTTPRSCRSHPRRTSDTG
jgi:NAD(P)-dependent dehydrogenase (short-subunit alcohol dehydrogenase family)